MSADRRPEIGQINPEDYELKRLREAGEANKEILARLQEETGLPPDSLVIAESVLRDFRNLIYLRFIQGIALGLASRAALIADTPKSGFAARFASKAGRLKNDTEVEMKKPLEPTVQIVELLESDGRQVDPFLRLVIPRDLHDQYLKMKDDISRFSDERDLVEPRRDFFSIDIKSLYRKPAGF